MIVEDDPQRVAAREDGCGAAARAGKLEDRAVARKLCARRGPAGFPARLWRWRSPRGAAPRRQRSRAAANAALSGCPAHGGRRRLGRRLADCSNGGGVRLGRQHVDRDLRTRPCESAKRGLGVGLDIDDRRFAVETRRRRSSPTAAGRLSSIEKSSRAIVVEADADAALSGIGRVANGLRPIEDKARVILELADAHRHDRQLGEVGRLLARRAAAACGRSGGAPLKFGGTRSTAVRLPCVDMCRPNGCLSAKR